jgi:hypothetical protein
MGKLKESIINQGVLFDDEVRKPMHPVKHNKTQDIARAWVRYAHVNKLKPTTKAYRQAQHAYLCGIGNAFGEEMPTLLSLCLASGRDIASIIESNQPR